MPELRTTGTHEDGTYRPALCGCGNPTHSSLVPCPSEMRWMPCTLEWLRAMPDGACGSALRIAGDGVSVSHYHPAPTCTVCQGSIGWVDCPTGGWWAHAEHPSDHHDAVPVAATEPDSRQTTSPDQFPEVYLKARRLAKTWRECPDAVLQEAGHELDRALSVHPHE